MMRGFCMLGPGESTPDGQHDGQRCMMTSRSTIRLHPVGHRHHHQVVAHCQGHWWGARGRHALPRVVWGLQPVAVASSTDYHTTMVLMGNAREPGASVSGTPPSHRPRPQGRAIGCLLTICAVSCCRAPVVRGTLDYTLFARLTASQCAESLSYGPNEVDDVSSSIGYLSTLYKDVEHTNWTQVIDYTNDGSADMRITWTFSTTKTLAERFADAVSSGESVTWEIYEGANTLGPTPDVTRTGTWRFSNTAGVTESRFDFSGSSFSGDDGCWGAPTTSGSTVDGNGAGNVGYGTCNYNSGDTLCANVYYAGSSTTYSSSFTYMYIGPSTPFTLTPTPAPSMSFEPTATSMPSFAPTVSPTTPAPTRQPTLAPTMTREPTPAPTAFPSPAPTDFSFYFARLTSTQCAESLRYGPNEVDDVSSSIGYLSTLYKDVEHTVWTQYVDYTNDGSPDMRITWTFSTTRTLAERFADAVSSGESVTWEIYEGVNTLGLTPDVTRTGTWRFSNTAGVTESRFDFSGSSFSGDDGCWGAPTTSGSTVDGNGAGNVGYGTCNYDGGDSGCSSVYYAGVATVYTSSLTYMYLGEDNSRFSASPSAAPTPAPSTPFPTPAPTERVRNGYETELTAANAGVSSLGFALALSNRTLVSGGPSSTDGALAIFRRYPAFAGSANEWLLADTIYSSADGYGYAVSVVDDVILVVAPWQTNTGTAYVEMPVSSSTNTTWVREKLALRPGSTAARDSSEIATGFDCALAEHPTDATLLLALVGSQVRAVSIFAANWTDLRNVSASANTSYSVNDSAVWKRVGTLEPSDASALDLFGYAVRASPESAWVFVGAPNHTNSRGAVYVFDIAEMPSIPTTGQWTLLNESTRLVAPTAESVYFGASIAVTSTALFVGAPANGQSGEVFVLTRGEDDWMHKATLTSGVAGGSAELFDFFGEVLTATSNQSVLVGAPGVRVKDTIGGSGTARRHRKRRLASTNSTAAGAVYVYEADSAESWDLAAVLTASGSEDGDGFGGALVADDSFVLTGSSVTSDGGTIVVLDTTCGSAATCDCEDGLGIVNSTVEPGTGYCSECPPGWGTVNSGYCMPCKPGHSSDTWSTGQCSPCATGTFANSTGALNCSLCAPGTAQSLTGQANCTWCRPGTYETDMGSLQCAVCEAGTAQTAKGAVDCDVCPANFYSAAGDADCSKCPSSSISVKGSARSGCEEQNLIASFTLSFFGMALCVALVTVCLCTARVREAADRDRDNLLHTALTAVYVLRLRLRTATLLAYKSRAQEKANRSEFRQRAESLLEPKDLRRVRCWNKLRLYAKLVGGVLLFALVVVLIWLSFILRLVTDSYLVLKSVRFASLSRLTQLTNGLTKVMDTVGLGSLVYVPAVSLRWLFTVDFGSIALDGLAVTCSGSQGVTIVFGNVLAVLLVAYVVYLCLYELTASVLRSTTVHYGSLRMQQPGLKPKLMMIVYAFAGFAAQASIRFALQSVAGFVQFRWSTGSSICDTLSPIGNLDTILAYTANMFTVLLALPALQFVLTVAVPSIPLNERMFKKVVPLDQDRHVRVLDYIAKFSLFRSMYRRVETTSVKVLHKLDHLTAWFHHGPRLTALGPICFRRRVLVGKRLLQAALRDVFSINQRWQLALHINPGGVHPTFADPTLTFVPQRPQHSDLPPPTASESAADDEWFVECSDTRKSAFEEQLLSSQASLADSRNDPSFQDMLVVQPAHVQAGPYSYAELVRMTSAKLLTPTSRVRLRFWPRFVFWGAVQFHQDKRGLVRGLVARGAVAQENNRLFEEAKARATEGPATTPTVKLSELAKRTGMGQLMDQSSSSAELAATDIRYLSLFAHAQERTSYDNNTIIRTVAGLPSGRVASRKADGSFIWTEIPSTLELLTSIVRERTMTHAAHIVWSWNWAMVQKLWLLLSLILGSWDDTLCGSMLLGWKRIAFADVAVVDDRRAMTDEEVFLRQQDRRDILATVATAHALVLQLIPGMVVVSKFAERMNECPIAIVTRTPEGAEALGGLGPLLAHAGRAIRQSWEQIPASETAGEQVLWTIMYTIGGLDLFLVQSRLISWTLAAIEFGFLVSVIVTPSASTIGAYAVFVLARSMLRACALGMQLRSLQQGDRTGAKTEAARERELGGKKKRRIEKDAIIGGTVATFVGTFCLCCAGWAATRTLNEQCLDKCDVHEDYVLVLTLLWCTCGLSFVSSCLAFATILTKATQRATRLKRVKRQLHVNLVVAELAIAASVCMALHFVQIDRLASGGNAPDRTLMYASLGLWILSLLWFVVMSRQLHRYLVRPLAYNEFTDMDDGDQRRKTFRIPPTQFSRNFVWGQATVLLCLVLNDAIWHRDVGSSAPSSLTAAAYITFIFGLLEALYHAHLKHRYPALARFIQECDRRASVHPVASSVDSRALQTSPSDSCLSAPAPTMEPNRLLEPQPSSIVDSGTESGTAAAPATDPRAGLPRNFQRQESFSVPVQMLVDDWAHNKLFGVSRAVFWLLASMALNMTLVVLSWKTDPTGFDDRRSFILYNARKSSLRIIAVAISAQLVLHRAVVFTKRKKTDKGENEAGVAEEDEDESLADEEEEEEDVEEEEEENASEDEKGDIEMTPAEHGNTVGQVEQEAADPSAASPKPGELVALTTEERTLERVLFVRMMVATAVLITRVVCAINVLTTLNRLLGTCDSFDNTNDCIARDYCEDGFWSCNGDTGYEAGMAFTIVFLVLYLALHVAVSFLVLCSSARLVVIDQPQLLLAWRGGITFRLLVEEGRNSKPAGGTYVLLLLDNLAGFFLSLLTLIMSLLIYEYDIAAFTVVALVLALSLAASHYFFVQRLPIFIADAVVAAHRTLSWQRRNELDRDSTFQEVYQETSRDAGRMTHPPDTFLQKYGAHEDAGVQNLVTQMRRMMRVHLICENLEQALHHEGKTGDTAAAAAPQQPAADGTRFWSTTATVTPLHGGDGIATTMTYSFAATSNTAEHSSWTQSGVN